MNTRRSTNLRRTVAPEIPFNILEIRNGGSHRGARALLPMMQQFNARTSRTELRLLLADPYPGRSEELASEARALSVPARASEMKIEELVALEPANETAPVLLTVDDVAAVGRTANSLADRPRAVLAQFIMRVPLTESFCGFGWSLAPDDAVNKRLGGLFAERLSQVVARGGSRYVIGDRARPEQVAAVPMYRKWFAERFDASLGRVAANLRGDESPFVLTRDGMHSEPLYIRAVESLDPVALARDLIAHPPEPLVRGEDFTIGAVLPKGVSLLHVRLRRDGMVSFRGSATIDFDAIRREEEMVLERVRREAEAREIAERAAAAREALGKALEELIERAARSVVSETSPAYVTD